MSKKVLCHDGGIICVLARISHNIAAQVLILAMTAIIFLEVIFRYFLGEGFKWTQEVCGLCFLLLVFICQAHTWQQNHHIRMDIFYNNFNRPFKFLSNLLTVICGGILYLSIIWQGFSDLQYQFDTQEGTEELMWPLWPFSLVMVFSSMLVVALLLRFSFRMHIFEDGAGSPSAFVPNADEDEAAPPLN